MPDIKGPVTVVTGATGGIGKAVALALARQGTPLLMIARDDSLGRAAADDVAKASGNAKVRVLIADLSSLSSVRRLGKTIATRCESVGLLLHCAAVFKSARSVTVDGLETMFATNHLAPFLLTNLLIPQLSAAGAARVLTVTAPSTVLPDLDDLQGERRFSPYQAFGASKMGNLLFSFALARRLPAPGVVVHAIHPGLVRSRLMREAGPLLRFVVRLASAPPARAASWIARVATAPEFGTATGWFIHNGKEITAPKAAYDTTLQDRLWSLSETLAGS